MTELIFFSIPMIGLNDALDREVWRLAGDPPLGFPVFFLPTGEWLERLSLVLVVRILLLIAEVGSRSLKNPSGVPTRRPDARRLVLLGVTSSTIEDESVSESTAVHNPPDGRPGGYSDFKPVFASVSTNKVPVPCTDRVCRCLGEWRLQIVTGLVHTVGLLVPSRNVLIMMQPHVSRSMFTTRNPAGCLRTSVSGYGTSPDSSFSSTGSSSSSLNTSSSDPRSTLDSSSTLVSINRCPAGNSSPS